MHRLPSPFRSPVRLISVALVVAAFAAALADAQPPPSRLEVDPPRPGRGVLAAPGRAIAPELDLEGSSALLDATLRHLGRSVAALGSVSLGASGEEVVPLLIRGSVATPVLRGIGVEVQSDLGELRTARAPLSALPALVRLAGVEQVTLGHRLRPQLDVSVPQARADTKRAEVPPLWGWYGKNVVVGIVDTGFDYQHDDFRNPDGSTRFYSIWDQNTPGVPPAGFGYGNECTTAQINAGTCSQDDLDGHGSHVAGIAAGDGSGTGNYEPQYIYTGMANGAQIIGVATNFYLAGVIDGVNYIFQKAAALGKPAVVNLSLGMGLGPHDGTTAFEQSLNALTGSGKIVCASAGNAQTDKGHASMDVQGSTGIYDFTVPAYTPNAGAGNDYVAVDLWHAGANSYAVRIKRPSSGTLLGPVAKGSSASYSTTDGQVLVNYTNTSDPGNGMSQIEVEINDVLGTVPKAGAWQIQLTPVVVPSAPRVHAWMDSWLGSSGAYSTFAVGIVDSTINVSSPATADSLIAVAGYTSKRYWAAIDGGVYNFTGAVDPFQINPYSARGPRRDGALKPDITAPGSAIGSVLSAAASLPVELVLPDGVHFIYQGTSMASPHVTGAVAMLLQKHPTLTPAGAKALLRSAARFDATTGAVPNPRWGAGRLDLDALLCSDGQAPVVTPTYPQAGNNLYAGTEAGITWTATDDAGVQSITLEYRIGSVGPWNPIASGLPNTSYHKWTVPGTLTSDCQIRYTAFDCVGSVAALGPSVAILSPSVGTPPDLPAIFAAYRPAPNPFSRAAALRFDLPGGGGPWPADVSVYNVAGRKVRTVVRGDLPPGRYTYEWDGRDDRGLSLSAGIYFVMISAGPYEARERVVYLR